MEIYVGGRVRRPEAAAIALLQTLAFALVCTTAHAAYQAGLDAYNAGDYTTAMAEWKEERCSHYFADFL